MRFVKFATILLFSLFGCSRSSTLIPVELGQYIVVKALHHETVLFGAFKVTETQPLLKYEWIYLSDGSTLVDIEKEETKLGVTGDNIRDGTIQFKHFRLNWISQNDKHFVKKADQNNYMVSLPTDFCVTKLESLWGQDLTKLECEWSDAT